LERCIAHCQQTVGVRSTDAWRTNCLLVVATVLSLPAVAIAIRLFVADPD
jgi:hypothetical protein